MSTTGGLPHKFSGVAQFKTTTTDYRTGTDSVAVYTNHYSNGVLHREDGPAVLLDGKPYEWYLNGQELTEKEFDQWLTKKQLDEKLPIKDGRYGESGIVTWYRNGLLHRDDGPAIEYANGSKLWFINDIEFDEEEFNQWLMKKDLNEKLQSSLKSKPVQKRSKI